MKIKRSSGLLMHITSLPGNYGIGTMGKESYKFVDLLKEGGQKFWQVLPLGPVSADFAYSPYSSYSSFAGNYLLINLEMLQEEEWMRTYIMSDFPRDEYNDFVEFEKIVSFKLPLLENAAKNFFKYADDNAKKEYNTFCNSADFWLEDYALFVAVAEHFNTFDWVTWEEGIRKKQPEAVKYWQKKLKPEIDFHKFIQFIFFKQWMQLKKYTNERGIKIIGDIPIYVTADSADTWASPEIFQLDPKTMRPARVAGVPPDYFSKTGQRWGNPLYTWYEKDKLKKETLDWWLTRFRYMQELFDVVRIDHFRGFEAYWSIPREEETAINGSWEKGPGQAFFKKIKEKIDKKYGDLNLIAEDLGVITSKVEKLRDEFEFPGMKVLQFAFSRESKNSYLPCNYTTTNCVVFTGTHDNNTTNGWFYEHEIDEETREYVMKYMNLGHQDEFHWELIKLALNSIADLAMFPVQDILGYAGRFRMNTPGIMGGNNWRWKLTPERLTSDVMHKLKSLCTLYNRV